ncbi:hypothetical protein [Anabaena lutea]|uniref:PEP-CTERM sorting domain-containing protein n=1 Tax=Anabaena lutea FACHB-196 TaxID=2692881 RepID=A0ABR8FJC3_9NOST|nr:hypothetical protein [Anabaena lutea]MBD2569302.1 hypothetical protein [Anabaena lutea FACHB-196]
MKLSQILPLVVCSAAAGILASMSPAKALDFNFTLSSTVNTNIATGTIYGLTDNATSSASQITINSLTWSSSVFTPLPFSINIGGASQNSFTVSGGTLTGAAFQLSNGNYDVYLNGQGQTVNVVNDFNNGALNFDGFSGVTYTPVSAAVPFDIPGGATIPTVGSLLALGAMRKAKKRLAAKTLVVKPVETVV